MSLDRVTVIKACYAATRYLCWPRLNPDRALALIAPYADREDIDDPDPVQILETRSIVCAVVGDCYQALKQPEMSAAWYLRASWCTTAYDGWPFYGPYYARVVVDFRLADHYGSALECLRTFYAKWYAAPIVVRLITHVISTRWLHPECWQMQFRERRLLTDLEALFQENGGSTKKDKSLDEAAGRED